MAARSIGSGTISFGLVSIPFKIFTATSAKSVSFNMLHKTCGSRLKQQLLCPVDNVVVERTDTIRGFEYARDQYQRGRIDNRDLVLAEDDYVQAQNAFNQAKTSLWTALLEFRLAMGTLRVDESGAQHDDPALHEPSASNVADSPTQPGARAEGGANS